MKNELIELLSKELGISSNVIRLDSRLYEDLGVESIDLFTLIEEIEKTFNVSINDMYDINTVSDILEIIEK